MREVVAGGALVRGKVDRGCDLVPLLHQTSWLMKIAIVTSLESWIAGDYPIVVFQVSVIYPD